MLLLLLVLASVALVPLGGGRPHSLAEMRLRSIGFLLAAVALQVALVLAPGESNALRIAAYLGSYLLAGAFLVANRHVSGLWLIGLGAAMNFTAIVANAGVMPAESHAIVTSGLVAHLAVYSNSIPLEAPHLALFGDIFAIPASWPFSNVFSLGDVCIAIGAIVTVHRTTGSRLVPSGAGRFSKLAKDREFVIRAAGHAASSLGGWTLAAALVYRLADGAASVAEFARGAAILLGVALMLQAVCAEFLARSGIGDPRRVIIGAEYLRVLAILSLALPASPSLLHLALAAGSLGATAPPIRFATTRGLPDGASPDHAVAEHTEEAERSTAENAALIAITGLTVIAAPPIASALAGPSGPGRIAVLGVAPVAAAVLFARRHSRQPGTAPAASRTHPSARRPNILAFLALSACFGLAAAIPLQPEFPGPLLNGETDVARALLALEFIVGVWGAGMILGAVAAPALASRVRPEHLFGTAIGGMGVFVLATGTWGFSGLLLAWLLAGVALAIAGVSARSICDRAVERIPAGARLQAAASAGLLLGGGAAVLLGVGLTTLLGIGAAVLLGTSLAARRLVPPSNRERTAEEVRGSPPR